MSTLPLDRDDEVEQLIRQLVTYTLRNRKGRVPVAFGFRVIYAPADSALESPSEEDFIETEPEVTTIDDKVVVVTELPGVNAENIRMALSGRVLQIVADQEHRHYRLEARLPQLHLVPMRTSLKHGILEIMFGVKPDNGQAHEALTD
jgi:HSP20 family molecular chaperone IbpA